MTVISLIEEIRSLIGDEDDTNYRYTDNVYRDRKIPSGLRRFNINEHKRFVVSGTGDTAVFQPTPSDEEKTLICLYVALAVLDGEVIKASNTAVVVGTPAGRTDLTSVARELREQRKALMEELNVYKQENSFLRISKELEVESDEFI